MIVLKKETDRHQDRAGLGRESAADGAGCLEPAKAQAPGYSDQ